MKNLWLRHGVALFALALLAGAANSAFAQYLVSAKAGFVNRADGSVYIQRADNENGTRGRASLGTQMKEGDSLITGDMGRAEILLNPGSYLRLNGKTEVKAVNTMLDEIRFQVVSGSVIVESGELEKNLVIEIQTPQGIMSVNKPGLQRIDIADGATTIAVRQGEAFLGTRNEVAAKTATKIARGKQVRLSGSTELAKNDVEQSKINKDVIDAFDTWSFNRAQSLMAANYNALRSSGTTARNTSFAYGWFFSPFYNSYTFIPRGGFFSPYGFPFGRRFSDFAYYFPYGMPYYYYVPSSSGAGGGGTGGGNANARIIAGIDRAPIERGFAGRQVGGFDNSGFGRGGGVGSSSGGSIGTTSAPVSTSSAPSRGGDIGGASGGGAAPSRGGRP